MSTIKSKKINNHKYYMELAFKQASKILGNTSENPAVGCVVVKNGVLTNLTHTERGGRPHAENLALRTKKINFSNSSLYSTLEPCSHHGKTLPCTDLIIQKKIKNVYFSAFDPDRRNNKKAKDVLKKKKIKTFFNILKDKGNYFYKDFFIKKNRPRIFFSSKLATSNDLFIKSKNKKWITNIYSRKRVHLLRSKHDAILSTSKTILDDNSLLNCRIDGLERFSPNRIVLDKNLIIPLNSKIFTSAKKIRTILFYNNADKKKLLKLRNLNIETIKVNLNNDYLDFNEIVFLLKKIGLYRILIEAGIEFNNFLLDKKYINDLYHFFSSDFFKKNGLLNAKPFFNKLAKTKCQKKKINVYLFNDQLIKYFVQ